MPEGNPIVGEIWKLEGSVRAHITTDEDTLDTVVVAEVTDTMVVLVNLLGNRIRMPLSRFYGQLGISNAVSLTFVHAPNLSLSNEPKKCNTPNCFSSILSSVSGLGPKAQFIYYCAMHIPIGVSASLPIQYSPIESRPCSEDEDLDAVTEQCIECADKHHSVLDLRYDLHPWRFWECIRCSARWAEYQRRMFEDDSKTWESMINVLLPFLDLVHVKPVKLKLGSSAFYSYEGFRSATQLENRIPFDHIPFEGTLDVLQKCCLLLKGNPVFKEEDLLSTLKNKAKVRSEWRSKNDSNVVVRITEARGHSVSLIQEDGTYQHLNYYDLMFNWNFIDKKSTWRRLLDEDPVY